MINDYAQEVFAKLFQAAPGNGDEKFYSGEKVKILDVGLKAKGGWSSGKALIEALIGGLGWVSFGEMRINGFSLPTVDIYFDSPAKVCLPSLLNKRNLAGYTAIGPKERSEAAFGFIETEQLPEEVDESIPSNLLIASSKSLVSAIYNSATAVPKAVRKLQERGLSEEKIIWAWGSCPVAIPSDKLEIAAQRKEDVLNYGAVVSIWVRADDEALAEFVRSWDMGEIRLHNLGTAKTFIGGEIDEAKLAASLL